MSTDSADATASWLYEAVIRYLQGPMYTTPLMGFIDAKCLVFDDEEENKLEFTVVHNEFKDLVEGLLSDFLNELGVTPERFVDVVERANAERELGDFVASSILTVDDFLQFKAMMVRRNRDLTKEVLEAHGMATDGSSATARAVTDADNDAPATPRRNADKKTAEAAEDDGDSRRRATESSAPPPMSPDSVYLAKAMRESAAQFENEQREIERAIERTRLARERERAAEEEAAKRLAAEREDARICRAEEEDAAEADEEEEEDVAVDDVALRRALKMSSAQFALDAVAKSERERREKILEEHERAAMAESEREARRNAPVPEFEEERVTSADDGFDAGAVEQAVAMSVAQLEKDRAAAAAKAEAELEKKRLEKEREEEMERAADAALRADVQTALERSVGVAAEEAAAFERERLELERALSLSLEAEEVAKKELVDAIERDTSEASSEASLEETAALQPEREPAGVDAAEPTEAEAEAESTDVSDAASPRRLDGVVDRLTEQTKVPLGAEGPPDASECLAAEDKNVKNVFGSKSLASLASLPPLTRVGALRGAGYRKTKAFTVSSVPETDGATSTSEEQKRHAVREAAVAAAAAQKALVIEKQLDLKRRADAAAARAALAAAEATAAAAAAAGLEDAATLERKRRFMAEQRGMLVARKAAERQRELAAHEARTHASVVAAAAEKSAAAGDPKEKENVSAFPAVGKAVAFPVGAVLSEEQQRLKREALRTELARRMKSGLAARNAWGETETYV
jgi:hypothetical protein